MNLKQNPCNECLVLNSYRWAEKLNRERTQQDDPLHSTSRVTGSNSLHARKRTGNVHPTHERTIWILHRASREFHTSPLSLTQQITSEGMDVLEETGNKQY
jgi:hypothetical protein